MIAPNSDLLCRQAEPYYYDYLFTEGTEPIPTAIRAHIGKCPHCQAETNSLGFQLVEAAVSLGPEAEQSSSAIIANLKLHFTYIDKRVTCRTARSFLPSLLDPALEVKIPTPVTVHLDNCEQCRGDLEIIRQLNLNPKQLQQLGRLLADEPAEDTISCEQAVSAVRAVAAMDWAGIDAETLKHVYNCPACRGLLYEERQKICDALSQDGQASEFPCESVSATDIFDYCFPFGIDPSDDQYAMFRKSLTSHLNTCRTCLTKMQQLHNTICRFIEAPESGVATIYTIDRSAAAKMIDKSVNIYAGFPIRVEVTELREGVGDKASASIVDFTAALKRKISAINLSRLSKVAAATVILVAAVWLLNVPIAKAMTIEKIYKAIANTRNVYITKFSPYKTEPIQEKLVSRELNIYMVKNENETTLWDISNRLRKAKKPDSGVIETIPLIEEELTFIKRKMTGVLGLMPFYDIAGIPPNAQWKRVPDEKPQTVTENIEVYDMTWTAKAHDGYVVFKKWRAFVDSKTNLPQRTEVYLKPSVNEEYTLVSIDVIEYPDDSEIRVVLEEASF